MKKEHSDFFWPSYVDLMTGLFIVILVLFVLSYKLLSDSKKASEEKLKKIEEIQKSVNGLPQEYFKYENEYKRYILTRQISFATGRSEIPAIDENYLENVGASLRSMIDSLQVKYAADSIKYILVIEGMASKDKYSLNNQLSYERALSVYNFWLRKNIKFNPSICETMISGSGIGGVGRDTIIEANNQRIIIQVIPKLSKFIESNLLHTTDNDKNRNSIGQKDKPIIPEPVKPDNTPLLVAKKKYSVNIQCYPSSAILALDGKLVGNVPYNGTLFPKSYKVKLTSSGYKTLTGEIYVDSLADNHFSFFLESEQDNEPQ